MTAAAIARGLGAALRPRLLLALYVPCLVLALAVAAPYGEMLGAALYHRPDPEVKAEHVDPAWFDDVKRQAAPALTALGHASGFLTWGWMLASTVLSGGVIGAFDERARQARRREGRRWSYRVFFADVGRNAGRLLALFVVSLLLFHLLDRAMNEWLHEPVRRFTATLESERLAMGIEWLRQGVFLLAAFALATWFDYGRVAAVLEKRASPFGSLASAAHGILAKPSPVIVVSVFFLLAEIAWMALGAHVLEGIATRDMAAALTWLGLSQALVLGRIGLGIGRLSAYALLVEASRDDRDAPRRIGREAIASVTAPTGL